MALQRPGRLAGRIIDGVIALCVSRAVLVLPGSGHGPVPAAGRALDHGHGAWASAAGGLPARSKAAAGLWLGRALAPGHG